MCSGSASKILDFREDINSVISTILSLIKTSWRNMEGGVERELLRNDIH